MIATTTRRLTAAVLLLALGVAPSLAADAPAPPPVRLRVLMLPFMTFAPIHLAQEEGFYAQEGLQVEFVHLKDTAQGLAALMHGELDVAAGLIGANILNVMGRGARVRMVADKGYAPPGNCTLWGMLARPGLEEGRLADPSYLKGLRFEVEKTKADGFLVDRALKAYGLSLDQVATTSVPPANRLEAFHKGNLDLASVNEPWLTRMRTMTGARFWKRGEEIYPDFQWGMILYGPRLLDEDPEAGHRFMRAYLRGVRAYNQGKTPRNLDIFARFTGQDRELLQEMCWSPVRSDGTINVQSVLDFQAWSLATGAVDRALKPEEFWDPRFVARAGDGPR
jgi:NitT/TauT family transport system substrate-binding protein